MRENTNKTLRPLAANLRRCMTDAENRLWYHLRNRRFHGIRFNRQAVIGGYIVDFLNREHKIIIEVDGAQHQEQQTYDAARSTHLQQQGYRVIRFWNHDVLTQTETVLAVIYEAIRNPSPAAPFPRKQRKGNKGNRGNDQAMQLLHPTIQATHPIPPT